MKPFCCHQTCTKGADFSIQGSSGHLEDITDACQEHVGDLLGTPIWLSKENEYWHIRPISAG